jgi:putative oxidoreductase
MLLKNIAIAGGLLCLTALDTVRWSYDAMRERRRAEIATREAELRAHDAELRAARAEGVTEATRPVHSGETVVTSDGTIARKRRWLF